MGSNRMVLRLATTKTGPNNPFSFAARRSTIWSVAELGLSHLYVPHSLHHGAASHDSLRGLPVEEILRLGRWASTKSARLYIQSTRAVLISIDAPKEATALEEYLLFN